MGVDKRDLFLEVDRLTLMMGNTPVLRNVSFCVHQAQVITIMGENGAGKSTLLKALSRDIDVTEGELNLASYPLSSWRRDLLAKMMAVLPQTSALNFPFLVSEVVLMGRTPHATGVRHDQDIVDSVLSKLDITHLANKRYTELSGGEKQRVQLARVIAQIARPSILLEHGQHGPVTSQNNDVTDERAVLLLDEPTSALDIAHQHALMRQLRELKGNGVTVVMVLHDFNLAAQYSDRVLLLHDHGLYMDGAPQNVFTPEILKTVFHVDATILKHPTSLRPIVTI